MSLEIRVEGGRKNAAPAADEELEGHHAASTSPLGREEFKDSRFRWACPAGRQLSCYRKTALPTLAGSWLVVIPTGGPSNGTRQMEPVQWKSNSTEVISVSCRCAAARVLDTQGTLANTGRH